MSIPFSFGKLLTSVTADITGIVADKPDGSYDRLYQLAKDMGLKRPNDIMRRVIALSALAVSRAFQQLAPATGIFSSALTELGNDAGREFIKRWEYEHRSADGSTDKDGQRVIGNAAILRMSLKSRDTLLKLLSDLPGEELHQAVRAIRTMDIEELTALSEMDKTRCMQFLALVDITITGWLGQTSQRATERVDTMLQELAEWIRPKV